MFQLLHVKGFRSIRDASLEGLGRSNLFIGSSGSGKSTILRAFKLLRAFASQESTSILRREDSRSDPSTSNLSLDCSWQGSKGTVDYNVALYFSRETGQWSISGESILVNQKGVLYRSGQNCQVVGLREFVVPTSYPALPLIIENEAVNEFRRALREALILEPSPDLMSGQVTENFVWPLLANASNIGGAYRWLLGSDPETYSVVADFLKDRIIGFRKLSFLPSYSGQDQIQLETEDEFGSLRLPLDQASDGEKILILAGLTLAWSQALREMGRTPIIIWDEPENYVGFDLMESLAREFIHKAGNAGQLFFTSHNIQVIHSFTDSSTYVVRRRNGSEGTKVHRLDALEYEARIADYF